MTTSTRGQEFFELSTAEKLEMPPEQREDLARRLAEAHADPDGGVPWEVARERIRQRIRERHR